MSLSYVSTRVMAPSVAPSTSAAGSTFRVASRRVNLDGQVSAFSPIGNTNLPATITPQSYLRIDEYLADQILISNDSGVTWRLVPGSIKGAQVVPTFNSSWATVANLDNQSSLISTLNLGNFSALSNPNVSMFVLNNGAGVQSFTYSFVDLISQLPASQYSGLIEVEIDGVYDTAGSAPSTLYNGALIWNGANSLNTQKLILGGGQYVKLNVRLVNFPAGGFSSQEVNLSMQVVANQTSFTLGFAEQWPNKTLQVDLDRLPRKLFVGLNSFSILVRPFMVNYNGRLLVNWFDRQINFGAASVERWLAVLDNGNIRAYETLASVPTNSVLLGKCTTTGSAPWITGIEYMYQVRPESWGFGGGTVAQGLFVKFASSGVLETTSSNDLIGVSLGSGLYASLGKVLVRAGEALAKGDLVGPGAGGKAFKSGGYGVVLEDGPLDGLVLVELARNATGAGGSAVWGGITGTLSAQSDLNTALNARQPLAANLTTVAGWTADQISRAGGLPSATSGTLEKTGANTYGTYTVTTAAKSVLDDSTTAAMLTTLGGAPLASPGFTGTPTGPTAAAGTNNTQLATTAFVHTSNLATAFAIWPQSLYNLALPSATDTAPTLVAPTVFSGSGFSTAGYTVPAGLGGLYYIEVYGEIAGSAINLVAVQIGIRRNGTPLFRRNQINSGGLSAFVNSMSTLLFMVPGDSVRPDFRVDLSGGTATLLNAAFVVHRLTSWT